MPRSNAVAVLWPLLSPFRVSRTLAWSLVDQGLTAAAPLLAGLAMLALASPAEFGRHALMTAGSVCGGAVFTALVHDPFTVRRTSTEGSLGDALGILGFCSVALWLIALPFTGTGTSAGAVFAGIAWSPALAILILTRRCAHRRGRTAEAAVLSTVWVLLCALALLGLAAAGRLTAGEVFAATSLIGVLVGAVGLWRATPVLRFSGWRTTSRHHFRFGGWLLAATPAWMASSQGPVVLLGLLRGEADAGQLRALLLFVLPMAHIAAAVGNVLQPRLAEAHRNQPPDEVVRTAVLAGVGLSLCALVWVCLLAVLDALTVIAFAGPAAVLVGAASVVAACNVAPTLLVRAARQGYVVFAATHAAAVLGLAAGMSLIPAHGVGGAAAATFAASVAAFLAQSGYLAVRPRKACAAGASA